MGILSIIVIILLSVSIGSIVWWSIKNGISPMPTSKKCRKAIFELIPRDFKGNIYELGSGWGTLLFPLAKHYPSCRVIGYETSHIPYGVSRVRAVMARMENITIHRTDFFAVSLRDADLVVCYLYPGAMRRLKDKFEKELKPGAMVISNTFAIPGMEPEKEVIVDDLYRTKIYLYRFGGIITKSGLPTSR